MGTRDRTRPDESRKHGYITANGYRRLEEEAHRLWTQERPKVARAVQVAAAEGDRSENAEYLYSKRKLAEIDRRLAYLGKRLDVLTVVAEAPPDNGKVYFGSFVAVLGDSGKHVYRIVGPDETNADAGWISSDSPVAKALLGREEGDEVVIKTPRGEGEFEILRVSSSTLKSSSPLK